MALYRWPPRVVWGLELFETLDLVEAGMAQVGLEAMAQAMAFLDPKGLLEATVYGMPSDALTLAEEFGEEAAAEIEAVKAKAAEHVRELLTRRSEHT